MEIERQFLVSALPALPKEYETSYIVKPRVRWFFISKRNHKHRKKKIIA